jgi:hypothetical protein
MFAIQKEHDNHIDHYLHPIQEELKRPKLSQACSFFYFIISPFFFSFSLCFLSFSLLQITKNAMIMLIMTYIQSKGS